MSIQFFSKANKSLLVSTFLLATTFIASQNAMAKPGLIIKGENGTKWCCPGGKKDLFTCVKGASSTPVGARCNFAEKVSTSSGNLGDGTTQVPAKPSVDTSTVKSAIVNTEKGTKQAPEKQN